MTAAFDDLTPTAHALPNGVILNLVRAGSGTPLVFIHGAMGDWRSWAPQWDAFTAHYDCIAYSRRYSHPNPNTMPSPDHGALHEAEDLRLLLDALGLDQAILVGSSYGAFTALALAVRCPERVRAVVGVEPPLMKYASLTPDGAAVAAEFRQRVIEPANAAFRAGQDEEAGRIMTAGIAGARSPLTSGPALQRRLQNLRAMKMLALSSDEFPWLAPEQLAALPLPVLLLSGVNTEPVHRAIFTNLSARMPAARAVLVEGAGHGVTREQPTVFNTLALEFLATVAHEHRAPA